MTKKLLFVSILMLLFSCSKQPSDVVCVSSVAVNPYDFVGEAHNRGLDAVKDSIFLTKSYENTTIDDIVEYSNNFCKELFLSDIRFAISPNTKAESLETHCQADTTISDLALSYMSDIIEVIETNDYEYIKDKISYFEEDILSNTLYNFSELEKAFLLCPLSVGKYSNEYWNANYSNETKSISFKKVVASDFVGALKGIWANKYVIVVSAIGGVGSVLITAGRSAIGPAIAGSAAYAFVEIW